MSVLVSHVLILRTMVPYGASADLRPAREKNRREVLAIAPLLTGHYHIGSFQAISACIGPALRARHRPTLPVQLGKMALINRRSLLLGLSETGALDRDPIEEAAGKY